jgi:hypothetical protein
MSTTTYHRHGADKQRGEDSIIEIAYINFQSFLKRQLISIEEKSEPF